MLTERFSLKGGEQQKPSPSSPKQEQPSDESKEFLMHSDEDAEDDMWQDESQYVSGAESEAAASFSNEQFLNDVLAQQDNAERESKQVPQQEVVMPERRETRATRAKSKANQANLANESLPSAVKPTTPVVVKRRGRSKSEKSKVEEEVPKNKRYIDYKKSMMEIDAKIAKHMRLTCNVCHEVQETFLLLCKHMMKVHHCKGYAMCCNKKFYKRSFLTDHIDRHSNPEKFK